MMCYRHVPQPMAILGGGGNFWGGVLLEGTETLNARFRSTVWDSDPFFFLCSLTLVVWTALLYRSDLL